MSDEPNPQELLFRAVHRPFFEKPHPGEPINLWYSWLSENCALWTFQTEAFLRLQDTELPSTDPLETIIASVLRDEGWDYRSDPVDPPEQHRLVENVYARREELGEGKRGLFFSSWSYEKSDGARRMQLAHPPELRSLAEPPKIRDWDDEGPVGSHTVQEEIGRRLFALIRARDAARVGTRAAKEAQDEIKTYLREITARRGRGRPPRRTDDDTLDALYREGRDLLDLAWHAPLAAPPETTRAALADLGVDESDNQKFWAIRLALPVFSSQEIDALLRFGRGEGWLSPRRLSILLLARRLDVEPSHVARRVVGADAEQQFAAHAGEYEI